MFELNHIQTFEATAEHYYKKITYECISLSI